MSDENHPVILGIPIKGRFKLFLDYLLYVPPNSRIRLRAFQIFVGFMFVYFGAWTIIAALAILEVANFIVWYRKGRTGELERKKKEQIQKLGGMS